MNITTLDAENLVPLNIWTIKYVGLPLSDILANFKAKKWPEPTEVWQFKSTIWCAWNRTNEEGKLENYTEELRKGKVNA